jgi:rRNA-processing protein FCF1
MEVILDSSFILSCIRKKIDFLEQLEEQGFRILVPREVLEELKDLKNKNRTSHGDRVAVDVALQMLAETEKTRIGSGRVDDGLISKGKEGHYIATLDNGIKREVPNKVVIFDAEKRVGIVRK